MADDRHLDLDDEKELEKNRKKKKGGPASKKGGATQQQQQKKKGGGGGGATYATTENVCAEWTEVFDSSSQKHYYMNNATRATQWSKPDDFDSLCAAFRQNQKK